MSPWIMDYIPEMKPIVRKPTKEEIERAKKWPIWEKEPSTFQANFQRSQETSLIIEGILVVKTDKGTMEIKPGDYVIFPQGLNSTWEVKEKLRKHWHYP